jgi:putative ABC transport system permease protein
VRTALAVSGVAVATALLLDMLMLGGGIESSFTQLLSSRDYVVRVTPAGTLPFDSEATIPAFSALADSIADLPGVAGVAPVLAANLEVRGRERRNALVLGVDPAEQGVLSLLEGRLPGEGESAVSEDLAGALGLAMGDRVTIALTASLGVDRRSREMEIVGIARFLYGARGELTMAVPIEELRSLTDRPDEAAFGMVRIAGSADAERIAAEIAANLPRVDATSVTGLVDQAQARLSYFRQLAFILGSVALLVAALLVGTIMTVSVNERYGAIAAMRAIGISRRSLVRGFIVEGLGVALLAATLGIALGVATGAYLERVLSDFPGLPAAIRFFVLDARSVAATALTVLVIGVLAAAVPAWHVCGKNISTTLHREEP